MSKFAYERRGKVSWLRLPRGNGRHSLTPVVDRELESACERIEEDEDCVVTVLTGTGNIFCNGLLPEVVTPEQIREKYGRVRGVEAIARLTKPTVAALNGDACGIGLEIALACDIRVTTKTARFSLPQVSNNVIPFGGATQRLPRIVGQSTALEMILTGRIVDADHALRIGLVSDTVPIDEFATRVDVIVSGLLGKGPVALRLAKEAVNKAMDLTLDQGMRMEEDLYALLQTTQDRAEGIEAFLARRKPRFSGR